MLEASAPYPLPKHEDGRLWAIALGLSLLGNVAIFGVAAFASIESEKFRDKFKETASNPAAEKSEASVLISPDMLQAVREKKDAAESLPVIPPRDKAPDFARTSEDQRGKRPDKPMFLGERDTEATSDKAPDPNAPPLPSQKGIEPRDGGDLETTESRYRDGRLDAAGNPAPSPPVAASPPMPPPVPEPSPAPKETAPPGENTPPSEPMKETADKASPEVSELKELVQGPNPVDVNVPKPAPEKSLPPPPPAKTTPPSEKAAKVAPDQKPPTPAKAAPKPGEPGFSGYQRKTAIQGSISRTGRSALDVADSPLGRYQAAISRAVEQEWQRNCVKHRDFITPGFLTVRFFIEPSGKVKSVQFVGEMQTGEIQKGFTLNSIRDADIPAMPKEIRADYTHESLELIFNFYF